MQKCQEGGGGGEGPNILHSQVGYKILWLDSLFETCFKILNLLKKLYWFEKFNHWQKLNHNMYNFSSETFTWLK